MRVWALRAALERMAALFVAGGAGHTALLAPCPAPQTNPHHPHTHMKTALGAIAKAFEFLECRLDHFMVVGQQRNSVFAVALFHGALLIAVENQCYRTHVRGNCENARNMNSVGHTAGITATGAESGFSAGQFVRYGNDAAVLFDGFPRIRIHAGIHALAIGASGEPEAQCNQRKAELSCRQPENGCG
jgi:hypothetical protein